jgi:AAA+ ATPase superfamily predicted ATPase
MSDVIGRYDAKRLLDKAFKENKASLFSVIGRRRVGKTYLIKTYMSDRLHFAYYGIHNVTNEVQLRYLPKQWLHS